MMKNVEHEYIKKMILEILLETKSLSIEILLDYLDYKNKVSYSKEDILPIINELEIKNKISFKDEICKIKQ